VRGVYRRSLFDYRGFACDFFFLRRLTSVSRQTRRCFMHYFISIPRIPSYLSVYLTERRFSQLLINRDRNEPRNNTTGLLVAGEIG